MTDFRKNIGEGARLGPALETRFSDAGTSGEVVGVAAGFGDHLIDSYGDTIANGAFAASLRRHQKARTSPVMLWAHQMDEPIGIWDEVKETPTGLAVRGRLNLDTQRGREAAALLKQGAFRGLSIGFQARAADLRNDGGRRITEADLFEVSLVAIPARREARIVEVRSIRDLETILRDAGLPRAAATKAAAGGFPALGATDHKKETLAQLAKMMRQTADRI